MTDMRTLLALLQEKNVVRASFNHDGTLASVEFGPDLSTASEVHEKPDLTSQPLGRSVGRRLIPRLMREEP